VTAARFRRVAFGALTRVIDRTPTQELNFSSIPTNPKMSTTSVHVRAPRPAPRELAALRIAEARNSGVSRDLNNIPAAEGSRPVLVRWKRALDIGFLVLLLPIWGPIVLMIALFIKLVSPGPVFFRQERVGYKGRHFVMLKFRSMRANAETRSHEEHLLQLMRAPAPMTKLDAADPRLILGGRVLRATGLDELPQFLNVWRGEMSIVGPRPSTTNEFKHYKPWECERLNALPGLTGYWQVNGKNDTTFEQMIHMDIGYARNASLRGDLFIMLKTIPVLVEQTIRVLKRSRRPAAQVLPISPAAHQ
jgi:lipopolysaccharide/colanic/teichoic acid biosynthesis glycosyltransferase